MEVDGWQLVVGGGWRLAVGGSWERLVVGNSRRLAVGGPWGLSFRAVLSKRKKVWLPKDSPGLVHNRGKQETSQMTEKSGGEKIEEARIACDPRGSRKEYQ